MSNSCEDAAVRHGPWVEIAKYASPLAEVSGFSPTASSCGALDVAPTYFRSDDFSSENATQPVAWSFAQFGSAPLFACSSKPATIDWTASAPDPWSTDWPLSGRNVFATAPVGRPSVDGWVMAEAGRGA